MSNHSNPLDRIADLAAKVAAVPAAPLPGAEPPVPKPKGLTEGVEPPVPRPVQAPEKAQRGAEPPVPKT